MTREEAIVVLKNEQPHCGEKALFSEEKKYEAFDLAIKALEKEPCDADNKLIPVKDCYVPYIHYDDVVKCVKGLPSVNPKSKAGHWIDGVCSECGWDAGQEAFSEDANFCMKCGVKMLPIGAEKE